jgi:Skp family chaperone for outer membrane proteins
MRLFRSITAALFVAALGVSAVAQQPAGRPAATTPAASRPASAAPSATGGANIAIIDIGAFGDEKTGIARLIGAYSTLQREFKPRQDELATMRTRGQNLLKEFDNLSKSNVADPSSLTKKQDELQTLEKEIKRKQEDAQAAVAKRESELTEPIWDDVNKALRAFAAQRGISVIFEKSKLAGNGLMFVVNDSVDITSAFIAEYNQRNPATASR